MIAKIKNYLEKHFWLAGLISIVLTLLFLMSILGMFSTEIYLGSDDLGFHLNRIQSIADNLSSGNILHTISPNSIGGNGYADAYFYPNLFLYFPAVLRLLGLPLMTCYAFYFSAVVICMFIFEYLFASKFLKNKWQSLIASILFVTFQYLVLDYSARGAVAEYTAIMFFVLVNLGVYNMLAEDFSKPYLLLFGILGVAYSHLITLVLVAIYLVIIFLCNIKKLSKQKGFYKKLFLIIGLFILLYLAFLVPFLEMVFADKYQFSTPWTTPSANALFGIRSTFMYNVSFSEILVILLGIPLLIKKETDKPFKYFYFVIIGVLFLKTKFFPWKLLDSVLGFIQFPFRLSMYSVTIIPIAFVFEVEKYFKKISVGVVKTLLSILFVIVHIAFSYWFTLMHCFKSSEDVLNHVGAGEYYVSGYERTFKVENQDGEIIEYSRQKNTVKINFKNDILDDFYDVPLMCYKGYEAYLKTEDGEIVKLEISKNDRGCIRVNNIEKSGEIFVEFKQSIYQKISFAISLATLIFVVEYFIIKRKKIKYQY